MTKRFEWDFFSKVPDHTRDALERYFLYGFEPGSFLKSVLCNDLYSSVARADTWNKQALADIVGWIAEKRVCSRLAPALHHQVYMVAQECFRIK